LSQAAIVWWGNEADTGFFLRASPFAEELCKVGLLGCQSARPISGLWCDVSFYFGGKELQ